MSVAGKERPQALTEARVIAYLREHPDVLSKYPDLLAILTPPERSLGDGVVDFQAFQLKNLQASSRDMKERLDGLIDYARGSSSMHGQVNEVVLRLLRCRSLEQVIEVIAIDIPSVLMVDVARLIIETDAPESIEGDVEGMFHSGLKLAKRDTVRFSIGMSHHYIIEDRLEKDYDELFADIVGEVFGGVEHLVRSIGYFQVPLSGADHLVMLALGHREPKHFRYGPGVPALDFLASVLASQLDRYLRDLEL